MIGRLRSRIAAPLLTITGRRGSAVLIGEEDGRAIWETQFLTWVPGLSQSIHRARAEDIAAGPLTSAGERRDAELIAPSADGRQEVASSGLKPRAQRLLELIAQDQVDTPPRFDKLVGDLSGSYSRRINIQLTGWSIRCSPTQRWSTSSAVPAL